jgi:predicted RecA/RadA family phage recombinase
MNAIYVGTGTTVDHRPTTNLPAGHVVIQNGLVGITKSPAPAGSLCALHIVGMFDIKKDASAFSVGSIVYWDATNERATSTETGNVPMGRAAAVAAASDPTVRTILLP